MHKKKLIEVALPLEAINIASAREKSIRHGHPSTLHLWWARRPLATCRAVLFASLVDDPSSQPEVFPTIAAQDAERLRLFGIIERLVMWENSNNQTVLEEARTEIRRHTHANPPPVLDPFAGGGSIPLEAQRLGLEAHASDLNPVAVLINKAMIEIPPKFAGQSPVNPEAKNKTVQEWPGATGLADDVRYYGQWMRKEAEKQISHLYPKATVWMHSATGAIYSEAEYTNIAAMTDKSASDPTSCLPHASDLEKHDLTVIAWIWARTVPSPNPAAGGAQVPLVRSFALSTKAGKETWIEPIVDTRTMTYQFEVRTKQTHPNGKPRSGTIGKKGGDCILTDAPMDLNWVREQAQAGKMGARLMAIVAEGKRGRVYISPTEEHARVASAPVPDWQPDDLLPKNPRDFKTPLYGMTKWSDLFTVRQLNALATFAELVGKAREKVRSEIRTTDLDADAYSCAVATYLGLAIDKMTDYHCSICTWHTGREIVRNVFARQAIPMTWDYVECNPLSDSTGNWSNAVEWQTRTLAALVVGRGGSVVQQDAVSHGEDGVRYLLVTDPPYYDNISYAALSDFFYVWLRHTLRPLYPDLFGTMVTPKEAELIADPYRQGGKEGAKRHFEEGMRRVFRRMCSTVDPRFPVTIIYAFKQSETEGDAEDNDDASPPSTASTGWETFLQALMDEGFTITGTWPMRTELANKITAGTNILASSIAIICRPRPNDALTASRRDFVNDLRRELADALRAMMRGNIAPVDLAQATIGPGMAVYSRYAQVLEPDGTPLRVRTALQIINKELDSVLAEQECEYDGDTRFCIAWFEQFGMNPAAFGEADVLARAKGTSVAGLVEGGVAEAKAGKVRLLKRDELPADWNPQSDSRRSVWETCQHLIKVLFDGGSEEKAAKLLADLGGDAEAARDLAYRLYSICERKGWAQEALAYNSLVLAWSEVTKLSANLPTGKPQTRLEL